MKSRWTRREVLISSGGLLVVSGLPTVGAAEKHTLTEATTRLLETSGYVYISPLRSNGSESKCHGEVWFLWDTDSVLIVTSQKAWKAEALRAGLDQARIWVGDLGRIRQARSKLPGAPSFLARARMEEDPRAFQRVLQSFGGKYPDEWDKWEPRFKKGMASGSRLMIRYTPVGA